MEFREAIQIDRKLRNANSFARFYVAEANDGRIIVVDGLQRLTTFVRFLSNELRLSGLLKEGQIGSAGSSLEGKTFEELSLNLRERVLDTQLTMYILDAKAPERARLDIFREGQ